MKLNFQKNILIVAIMLIISLVLTGCGGNEQEKARSELAKLNIAYTPESFLNCIQNNDTVVFKLFMQVGMEVNAKNQEGVTALMLASNEYVGGVRHPEAEPLDTCSGEIRHLRRQDWTLTA